MWYRSALVCAPCLLVLVFALPVAEAPVARAQEARRPAAPEPLVDKVRVAIQRGVQYLRDQEGERGHWELDGTKSPTISRAPGGETALVLLALINAGVPLDDPMMKRGLEYLRKVEPRSTYTVGLQTMVLASTGTAADRLLIQRNVDWLVKARVMSDEKLLGWSYGSGASARAGADGSNTQYALLGLHDGVQYGGAKVDRDVWVSIRQMYERTQNYQFDEARKAYVGDGGWSYTTGRDSTQTMTTAGLCGLYISAAMLNDRREQILPDGTAKNCGEYPEDERLKAGHAWLQRHFNLEQPNAVFYNMYGIERTGRLSGQRFLANHDWYREGCTVLTSGKLKQDAVSGSWSVGGEFDRYPVVSTSFALLFLSKGRTPVLISKYAHGPKDSTDWNNDRNDVRHLVDFASKEMFKRAPLAWQVFDAKRATMESDQQVMDVTGELLQSPILYMNGHKSPKDMTNNERRLLQEYVNNGGFVFAEACCGKKAFADGFRALVKELFDEDLVPLKDDHPVWHAHSIIRAADCPFKLEGLQQGCKTVIVFCPQDLSCLYESNLRETPRGRLAFRVGGNVIAYATGMELPRPRLTPMEVVRGKEDPKAVPRGFLKVAQLTHGGDWQPAPKAMRNLMAHLREKVGLDVALQTETMKPSHPDLPDFKYLYMHGRNDFRLTDEEYESLRANLQTNGLLFADACCGKKAFDKAFREFVAKLFPDHKLERISPTDDLFSKDLNGEMISSVRCRIEGRGGVAEKEYKDMAPYLEGIKYNGRWVVIYSKYDIGCALEKHAASDCIGYDNASAQRLAGAAVLYALKR